MKIIVNKNPRPGVKQEIKTYRKLGLFSRYIEKTTYTTYDKQYLDSMKARTTDYVQEKKPTKKQKEITYNPKPSFTVIKGKTEYLVEDTEEFWVIKKKVDGILFSYRISKFFANPLESKGMTCENGCRNIDYKKDYGTDHIKTDTESGVREYIQKCDVF